MSSAVDPPVTTEKRLSSNATLKVAGEFRARPMLNGESFVNGDVRAYSLKRRYSLANASDSGFLEWSSQPDSYGSHMA